MSLQEIFQILDVQEYLGDSPDATELEHVEGRVAFEGAVQAGLEALMKGRTTFIIAHRL